MGIGNPALGNEKGEGSLLITPHGDREPYDLNQEVEPSQDSLPLMGIGNATVPDRSCCSVRAHYPSWGSGTLQVGTAANHEIGSLPLMGIGNSALVRPFQMPPTLITPHGAREPAAVSSATSPL